MSDRKIKFLSRTLPFPTDPTFREYLVIEELTKVTAERIMSGDAGVWMLPILAIVALMRSNPNVTHEQLSRILDLGPQDIELEGDFPTGEVVDVPGEDVSQSTGTESTVEAPEVSGTPDSPTTSQPQPESPTT